MNIADLNIQKDQFENCMKVLEVIKKETLRAFEESGDYGYVDSFEYDIEDDLIVGRIITRCGSGCCIDSWCKYFYFEKEEEE